MSIENPSFSENSAETSMLGKEVSYDHSYDPSLLFPIPRSDNRRHLPLEGPLEGPLPFLGEDVWTGFELSWLNEKGKPKVAIAEFHIPFDSPNMIESKSFKLYLNSLNNHAFRSHEEVVECLESDLSAATGARVRVELSPASQAAAFEEVSGAICIDDIDCSDFEYQPNAGLLALNESAASSDEVEQTLFSELLRSNCPVTGQPDWATVYVRYRGKPLCHESLLRYIVSFRQCQDFHEHCVERMFVDLHNLRAFSELTVYARYTRRGGLDINPYRTTLVSETSAPKWRTARQ